MKKTQGYPVLTHSHVCTSSGSNIDSLGMTKLQFLQQAPELSLRLCSSSCRWNGSYWDMKWWSWRRRTRWKETQICFTVAQSKQFLFVSHEPAHGVISYPPTALHLFTKFLLIWSNVTKWGAGWRSWGLLQSRWQGRPRVLGELKSASCRYRDLVVGEELSFSKQFIASH